MARYVLFKRCNGEEHKLSLTSGAVIELETRMNSSLHELIKKSDRLSVSSEMFAAAMDNSIPYEERKKLALEIFDEMVDNGENIQNYQIAVFDTLVAAGFMKGEVVELARKMIDVQEKGLAKMTNLPEINE